MQLSTGLSSEYAKKQPQSERVGTLPDPDQQLVFKYYMSQILESGEDGIRDLWNKVRDFMTLPSFSHHHLILVASTC